MGKRRRRPAVERVVVTITPHSELIHSFIRNRRTSLAELAPHFEVDPTQLSRWINGVRPMSYERACVLAELLGARVQDIAEVEYPPLPCPHCRRNLADPPASEAA